MTWAASMAVRSVSATATVRVRDRRRGCPGSSRGRPPSPLRRRRRRTAGRSEVGGDACLIRYTVTAWIRGPASNPVDDDRRTIRRRPGARRRGSRWPATRLTETSASWTTVQSTPPPVVGNDAPSATPCEQVVAGVVDGRLSHRHGAEEAVDIGRRDRDVDGALRRRRPRPRSLGPADQLDLDGSGSVISTPTSPMSYSPSPSGSSMRIGSPPPSGSKVTPVQPPS